MVMSVAVVSACHVKVLNVHSGDNFSSSLPSVRSRHATRIMPLVVQGSGSLNRNIYQEGQSLTCHSVVLLIFTVLTGVQN